MFKAMLTGALRRHTHAPAPAQVRPSARVTHKSIGLKQSSQLSSLHLACPCCSPCRPSTCWWHLSQLEQRWSKGPLLTSPPPSLPSSSTSTSSDSLPPTLSSSYSPASSLELEELPLVRRLRCILGCCSPSSSVRRGRFLFCACSERGEWGQLVSATVTVTVTVTQLHGPNSCAHSAELNQGALAQARACTVLGTHLCALGDCWLPALALFGLAPRSLCVA